MLHFSSCHQTPLHSMMSTNRRGNHWWRQHHIHFKYYFTQNVHRLLNYFYPVLRTKRETPRNHQSCRSDSFELHTPGSHLCLQNRLVGKMIQAWGHSVLLQKFLFPVYLNAQGIISLLKLGPLHEDGKRFSWRERKICSCTRRFSCLNKWGTALWFICWKALGPGRTGKHLSNRHTQITNFPQQRKSGLFLFSFRAFNYREKT